MPDILITDSQDEQSLEDLFRDADQIHIPIFQRGYVWKKKQLDELCSDIELVKEGVENSQFLGAIVAYERPRLGGAMGRLRELDIVDGQQRLLTLYLFVMAIVEKMAEFDDEGALEVVQNILLLRPRRGLQINTRMVPGYHDRAQFRRLWERVNSIDRLGPLLRQNQPQPPLPSGEDEGPITKQHSRILRYISGSWPENTDERLNHLLELYEIVTTQLTFIHLKLVDASSATKIFERLNFRGVKVGIVDLVRNEILSREANSPRQAERIYHDSWRPFEESFEFSADGFFFPYCLIFHNDVKKSELFSELRVIWRELSPGQIIEHMKPFQIPYMAIHKGNTEYYTSAAIKLRIGRLHRMNTPSVVYPFLMKVLFENDRGNIEDDVCLEILDTVESFLVRRAIVGIEPTGLHALFKNLWNEIGGNVSAGRIAQVIESRPTIQFPDDHSIQSAIMERSLGKTKIVKYLLSEFDRHLPGDNPDNDLTKEHILPQSYDADGPWSIGFTVEQHSKYLDCWGNILPLSQPLNSSLQRAAYSLKRERYLRESMFVTPRAVAEEFLKWNPQAIERRGNMLAAWAINRWPKESI